MLCYCYLNRSSCNLTSLEEPRRGTEAGGPSCCGGEWQVPPWLRWHSSPGNQGPCCHLVAIPCPVALPHCQGLPPLPRLGCTGSTAQMSTGGWSTVSTWVLRRGRPGARGWARGPLQGICLSFESVISVPSDPGCWFHPCAHKPAHVLWAHWQPLAPVMEGDQGP